MRAATWFKRVRAAAPGRPKQGPTLSEGRSPYPVIGVLS